MANPFDLLKLPFRFRISDAELKRRRRALETAQPAAEKELRDSWRQAEAALRAAGGPVTELLRSKGLLERADAARPDSTFLMKVMELNELLMQIELGGEAQKMEELKKTIRSMETKLLLPVKKLQPCYADDSAGSEEWDRLIDYYSRQKYLLRFSNQLKGKL